MASFLPPCYTDSQNLKRNGFNAQAFKHINTVATFETIAPGVFPGPAAEPGIVNVGRLTLKVTPEGNPRSGSGLSVRHLVSAFSEIANLKL